MKNIFSRKKKAKAGSYIDWDAKLPDEPATPEQKLAIMNLCRFLKVKLFSAKQLEKMTKAKASKHMTNLLKLAAVKRKKLEKDREIEDDYRYDDEFYLDGWGDEH